MDSPSRYHHHVQSVGNKMPPQFLTLYSWSVRTKEVIKKIYAAHIFVIRSNYSWLRSLSPLDKELSLRHLFLFFDVICFSNVSNRLKLSSTSPHASTCSTSSK
ncbi:hypothetical protein NPIL_465521 [Nephila pilipes]|uniref:Uncharacterized protein n=1 Tax=Nephila pilipes TaxID=299642 RepID=A0A8X6UCQ5_NEPPI|nr:hypothetical protein NPIL_465521 [Nephila pilipes]